MNNIFFGTIFGMISYILSEASMNMMYNFMLHFLSYSFSNTQPWTLNLTIESGNFSIILLVLSRE